MFSIGIDPFRAFSSEGQTVKKAVYTIYIGLDGKKMESILPGVLFSLQFEGVKKDIYKIVCKALPSFPFVCKKLAKHLPAVVR